MLYAYVPQSPLPASALTAVVAKKMGGYPPIPILDESDWPSEALDGLREIVGVNWGVTTYIFDVADVAAAYDEVKEASWQSYGADAVPLSDFVFIVQNGLMDLVYRTIDAGRYRIVYVFARLDNAWIIANCFLYGGGMWKAAVDSIDHEETKGCMREYIAMLSIYLDNRKVETRGKLDYRASKLNHKNQGRKPIQVPLVITIDKNIPRIVYPATEKEEVAEPVKRGEQGPRANPSAWHGRKGQGSDAGTCSHDWRADWPNTGYTGSTYRHCPQCGREEHKVSGYKTHPEKGEPPPKMVRIIAKRKPKP